MTDKQEKSEYKFDSNNLLRLIKLRRMPIGIITLAGLLASIIISFTIQPKYKSTVVLFPASSTSASQELLTESYTEKKIHKFGEEEEVEQMLQVLQSNDIRSRIITQFDLAEHYNLNKKDKYFKTKLYEEYENNISFIRTEYLSIEIEVLDTDPKVSSAIANQIACLLDSVMLKLHKERAIKAYKIVEKEYKNLKNHIRELNDSLNVIRELGIDDYETMAEAANNGYMEAVLKNDRRGIEEFNRQKALLSKYGSTFTFLRDLLLYEAKKLSDMEGKLTQAKLDLESDLSYRYVVNWAEPAEKKSFPIIWLIVLISTISTFILSIFLVLLFDDVFKKKKTFRN
ncbi:MAG: hypothetical protein JXR58_08520 [Bacteroidales bacterium]|nr:hypothetical protein [Bacteroidales bacterium]